MKLVSIIFLISFINANSYFSKLVAKGKNNIAFTALFQLGAVEEVIQLLIKTERLPEAAMLARTYAPDSMSSVLELWKADLEKRNRKKTAESLADPAEYPNLFAELQKVIHIDERLFLILANWIILDSRTTTGFIISLPFTLSLTIKPTS